MSPSAVCAGTAVAPRHTTIRPAKEPRTHRSTARDADAISGALAPASGIRGSLRRDAAPDFIGQVQHAVDQLEPFPRVLGETVELGKLRRIPDAGQRGR